MKNSETKFRAYDSKGNFQQTYSDQLAGGFSWARDCAKRTSGYVLEVAISEGKVTSEKVVADFRSK